MKMEGLHVVRPRAAGLDVHKMEITATVRLCEGEGEPVMETRCFSALPSGLAEMVAWLIGRGVEAAVTEGTGVYRQAPFAALKAAGIEAILVHARQVKQLKGRKTDVADSVWLACVCQLGLCTPSHVPPEPFRELRSLSRQRRILVGQRSRTGAARHCSSVPKAMRNPSSLVPRTRDATLNAISVTSPLRTYSEHTAFPAERHG